MKILGIYDKSGPKYHRVLLPIHLLQQRYGYDVKVKYKITEDDVKDIDILFFNRLIQTVEIADLITWRLKYGFKLVCDLDDHWQLDNDHILYKQYKRYSISEKIAEFIEASDFITVTHDRLASEVLHHFQKSVHVLPNAIPRIDQFDIDKFPTVDVRLFWAGGITHKNDIALLKRPLELIKRENVSFIMGGYVKGDPEWHTMAKIFTTDSSYNTKVIEALPVHEYYKIYSHCDISLIPLQDTRFNTHKSNLKILEAANMGSPVVVSRVHPYLDFPEDVVNYVDIHKPWYGQIMKLVKYPVLRSEQGQALKEYCDIHFNFEEINKERKQIFEHCIKYESA